MRYFITYDVIKFHTINIVRVVHQMLNNLIQLCCKTKKNLIIFLNIISTSENCIAPYF